MAEGRKTAHFKRGDSKSSGKSSAENELKLCSAYLYRKEGCNRGDDCNFLHICRGYILQSCKASGHACKFSHDLSCRQPQALFRRQFGIKHLNGKSLHEFRELFAAALQSPSVTGSGQQSSCGEEETGKHHRQKLRKFLWKLGDIRDAKSLDRRSDFEGCSDGDYDEGSRDNLKGKKEPPKWPAAKQPQTEKEKQPTKICSFYVRGNCKFASHPGFRHCSSPFQWQIFDGQQHDWLDLTRQANDAIEEKFCNVNNTQFREPIMACSGESIDGSFYRATITFGVESFSVSNEKSGRVLDMRRLSTVSEAQPGRPNSGHSTQWIWYWQYDNQTWMQFLKPEDTSPLTSSTAIERKFLSFMNHKGPCQLDVTTRLGESKLDFSQMTLRSPESGYTHPLARRPKWQPTSEEKSLRGQSDPRGSKDKQLPATSQQTERTEAVTPKKSKVGELVESEESIMRQKSGDKAVQRKTTDSSDSSAASSGTPKTKATHTRSILGDTADKGEKRPQREMASAEASNSTLMATSSQQAKPGGDAESIPQICIHFLHGSCTFSEQDHQQYRHFPHPFQWQILDGMKRVWLTLTEQANLKLEKHYCDIKNRAYTGTLLAYSGESEKFVVKVQFASIVFGTDTFIIHDQAWQFTEARRLSTMSHVQANGWRKVYGTHWMWYWQNNIAGKWFVFTEENPESDKDSSLTTSAMIEKRYLKFKRKQGPSCIDVMTIQGEWKLDFSKMKQTQSVKGSEMFIQLVARRPKWNPHVEQQDPSKEQSVPVDASIGKTSGGSKAKKTQPAVVQKMGQKPDTSVPQLTKGLDEELRQLMISQDDRDEPEPQESSSQRRPSDPAVRPKARNPSRSSKVLQPSSSSNTTASASQDNQVARHLKQREFTYICPYFLRGRCIYEDDKYNHKRHFRTPYQWQFLDTTLPGADWENIPSAENDRVERSFCNVNFETHECNSDAPGPVLYVYFDENQMHGSTVDIHLRRLSTSSSVLKTNWEKAFCTEWTWYWLDERHKWIVYSGQNAKGIQAGIDSATIEQKFVDYQSKDGEPVIEFTAGGQRYTLDFDAMEQTNVHYLTCRKVRRRPKFVAMEERKRLAKELSQAQSATVAVPTTWDNRGTQTEVKLVKLTNYTSPEYTAITNLFRDTMDDRGSIISIKRIQNLELWEDFTRLGDRMKKKNRGKSVLTKQLFHGTISEKHATTICNQNFDWRLCGSNVGTLYGKGSYFARDAKFAHSYTRADELDQRYMFVVQVLVGTYSAGKSEYTRPPPRDPSKPLGDLYDSCVNDTSDPTIYVIFEKPQVYPEYLIKYKEKSHHRTASTAFATKYPSRVATSTTAQLPHVSARTSASYATPSQYTTSGVSYQSPASASAASTAYMPSRASSRPTSSYATSGTNPGQGNIPSSHHYPAPPRPTSYSNPAPGYSQSPFQPKTSTSTKSSSSSARTPSSKEKSCSIQ
ncbi:uncharacterized protein LOC110977823 isoform X2 [Acanthaster planci]|uniref:Uncharacterized protein LOC110977823 isoform X2 n=1 Tax=Acanthaster planci TaxID=133434 RepID=A0A8B7Y604_ACAPL|nr:uncharacterized protein LOC110977823 isoform X2 [Acanthaster planci]